MKNVKCRMQNEERRRSWQLAVVSWRLFSQLVGAATCLRPPRRTETVAEPLTQVSNSAFNHRLAPSSLNFLSRFLQL